MIEDPQVLLNADSDINDINTTEFPIVSLLGDSIQKKLGGKIVSLDSPNPRYAPEEFTYVPNPELQSNKVQEGGEDVDHDVHQDKSPVLIDNFENLRHINFRLTEDNNEYEDKGNLQLGGKCKELEEPGGFCAMSSDYPTVLISEVVKNCSSLISTFQAVVPDEVDGLGDTSESVITSEKDEERPWSWRVYAYKKRQACHSEVSLSRPSYAVDSEGETQLILQTASIVQRVAVDLCSSPGSACEGVAQCGLRSLCVQRYTYHYLLSITPGHYQHCPAIRAFKLPTACVCHAEVDSRESRFGDKLV